MGLRSYRAFTALSAAGILATTHSVTFVNRGIAMYGGKIFVPARM
jgi:hypothetical protein